ncbi:hypothetical protein PNEG_00290 [Pneumocystis murina B123]|uniref:Importin N-terminal domain-containing protein n=1 Tax=Pneumocystis murina (strain B123) TaxID=1069680 RepID=M7PLE9_PNEMU|nr:hypothetical protein PNEG_00290 [Pneumocystis murina B123]EMR11259.1 hypothetical protein PNEG_00290 [Pneumocystis murina B123]
MEQKIEQLLSFCQSTDAFIRKQAEDELKILENSGEYPISLINISASSSTETYLRQASLLILKKYVLNHWSPVFQEFYGFIVNQDIKNRIRNLLLELLSSELKVIRNTSAHVISKIAIVDWPDEWPDLLDNILFKLSKDPQIETYGGLKVLKELIDNALTSEHFFSISLCLTRFLYEISINELYSFRTRAQSLSVFKSCLDSLEMIKDIHPEIINSFAIETLDSWMNLFITIISKNIMKTLNYDFILFKLNVIKILYKLHQTFSYLLTRYLPSIFEALWIEIEQVKEIYSEHYILNLYESNEENDSDGELINLPTLLTEELSFIQISLKDKTLQKKMNLEDYSNDSILNKIIDISLFYSQLSLSQEREFIDNSNSFIEDELNENVRYTLRQISADVVEELGNCNLVSTSKILIKKLESMISGLDLGWRYNEAILFLVSRIVENFDISIKRNIVIFSLSFYNIEKPPELLRARAILILGQLSIALNNNELSSVFSNCISMIFSESIGVIKLSAFKTIQRLSVSLSLEYLVPFQLRIIDAIEFYISQVHNESLILLLEVLLLSVKIDRDAILYSKPAIISILFKIILHNLGDPYLIGIIQDIFEDLAKNVSNFSAFCDTILLPLKELFSTKISDASETQLTEVAFDLLCPVIKGGSSSLSIEFLEEIVPGLIYIMKNCDSNEVLQSAEEILRQIILKDYDKLISLKSETGISIFDEIVNILRILLEKSVSESVNFFFGPLVIAIIYRAGERFRDYLPDFLEAIVIRLTYPSSPRFCQELLLIFAHLIINQTKLIVDFLYNIKINGVTGLEILLKSWCENIDIIHGYKNIRTSSVALINLFMLQDQRFSDIVVKGDLIINESDEIITRSKAKLNSEKYFFISFLVKVIKILLKELSTFIEIDDKKSIGTSKADFSNDDDDEWEDDLDSNTYNTYEAYTLSNDDDSIDDPLNELDLQKFLVDFFKNIVSNNINDIKSMASYLTQEECSILASVTI